MTTETVKDSASLTRSVDSAGVITLSFIMPPAPAPARMIKKLLVGPGQQHLARHLAVLQDGVKHPHSRDATPLHRTGVRQPCLSREKPFNHKQIPKDLCIVRVAIGVLIHQLPQRLGIE